MRFPNRDSCLPTSVRAIGPTQLPFDAPTSTALPFGANARRREMPHLAEHIEQHLKPRTPEDEGEFAFGLDLILDGLERMR
ncbi:MAG: TetR/AcrR family transcriptional regulator C-terminal domain-containing protein [Chloroflexota bacterium]|nr:TetR/AcrR family transcriptional regulator C-terminal domain-containing protein [Chloroflexota bacterium]